MKLELKLTALAFCAAFSATAIAYAQTSYRPTSSPDEDLQVYVGATDGIAWYSISYKGDVVLPASRLGLKTDHADFSELELMRVETDETGESYTLNRCKTGKVEYAARTGIYTFRNRDGQKMSVEFRVSTNDIAFRYLLPREGETGCTRVTDELTEFCFLESDAFDRTQTWLTPQSEPMTGWKRTKPSYEEHYGIAQRIDEPSLYGRGYTFPCLFKVEKNWVLISETGVGGNYCGSRLGDSRFVLRDSVNTESLADDKLYYSYKLEYPMPEENGGYGTVEPALSLPGATPWRTITVSESLRPIVETTAAWNNLEPVYDSAHDYEFGKGTWSWIIWQDGSINSEDQKKYVDLAAEMGFRYVLVDNWWDRTIGRDGIRELAEYASDRGVSLFLWYSSSGWWNDIDQSPVDIMSGNVTRKKEMRWLQELGIKGIKVDFFGGDKQETMKLYESILSDADDYGLMVIFHGCTLPRGWERMYPNYVGSEAVRASENLVFSQEECDMEAVNACLHPFIRNTVGCMEFGGCILNERLDRTNSRGTVRRTTDMFQVATAVLFQNPVQNFAITPDNLEDAPSPCLDFLREVPTVWDETRLIEGEPGRYVVLARRHRDTWYITAVNATDEEIRYSIWDLVYDLQDICGSEWVPVKESPVKCYSGGNEPKAEEIAVGNLYKAYMTIGPEDGGVVTFKVAYRK